MPDLAPRGSCSALGTSELCFALSLSIRPLTNMYRGPAGYCCYPMHLLVNHKEDAPILTEFTFQGVGQVDKHEILI